MGEILWLHNMPNASVVKVYFVDQSKSRHKDFLFNEVYKRIHIKKVHCVAMNSL